jgi:hypothetical protein
MGGLFDGVGQSFLTGRAIGRGIRTAVNDRRVRKSVEEFDDLEAQAAAADAAGDAAAAETLRAQSTALARKAFKSADKLEGLVGEGAGQQAIARSAMGRGTAPATQDPNDPYANTRNNLDFTQRLSNRAGRDIDPGQREEVAARAADFIYGNQVVPAKEAAQREFAKNGKMSAETADRLVAGLTTLTMYMPQYKGAIIRVNPADNSIFIDRTGGDAADGETISSVEHLQAMDDLFSEAKAKPSSALATNMDARQKAQAAQDARTIEASKKIFETVAELLPKVFTGPPQIATAGLQASQKLATAGIKQAPLTSESAGLYETANPGVKFDSLMTMPDGRTYALGTSGVAAESGDVLPTAFIYDVTNRTAVSPDDWQRMQSQTDSPVTTSDLSAVLSLNRGLSAEAQAQVLSMLNQASMSYASGKLQQFSMPEAAQEATPTAIAPRGASPSTRGGKRGKGILDPETDDYINNITTPVTSPAYVAKHGKPPEGDARALAEWALPALVQQESGGDPNAVSPVGARGAFQIMPDTAANPGYGVTPIADWNNASQAEQREFAIQYLTKGIEKGGSLAAGLAFYNGGERQMNNLLGGAASGERMAAVAQRPQAPTASAIPPPQKEPGVNDMVPNSAYQVGQSILGAAKRGIEAYNDKMFAPNAPVALNPKYLSDLASGSW